MGFHMVIWLSGLQTISADLYEAAELDGAGKWEQFRYVTWPGLRQTRTFILITITIAAFSLFTQVNIMTQGGPLDSTSTVVLMAVRTGFQQQQTGYASAISLVFFVLVLIVTVIQRWYTREKEA
jgi:multiple sugar transport system permease protein